MRENKGFAIAEDLPGALANRLQLSPEAALLAGRETIGMWPALIWAFKHELVRYSCGTIIAAKVSQSNAAQLMSSGATGIRLGADGGGYSSPCCHADAIEIYIAVSAIVAGQGERDAITAAFQLLIQHSEADAAPTWDPEIRGCTTRPVIGSKGGIKHIYGKSNVPLACEVVCAGDWNPQAIRDVAHARYGEWCRLMGEVINRLGRGCPRLSRFQIQGLGVDPEPWLSQAQIGDSCDLGKNLT